MCRYLSSLYLIVISHFCFLRKTISSLIKEHVVRILAFRRSVCEMAFPLTDLSLVCSLCRLLECFTFHEKSLTNLMMIGDEASYIQYMRLWFLFCVIWGICGTASQQVGLTGVINKQGEV